MAINQTSIAGVISKMSISTADKRALLSLFNGVYDTIDTLRTALNAELAKLDTAGGSVAGLGTNHAATNAVATSALPVKKS